LDSNAEYALIFEDDATFEEDHQEVLSTLANSEHGKLFQDMILQLIKAAPVGWDEINLARCLSVCKRQRPMVKLSALISIVDAPDQLCSVAYLLNRRSANFLKSTFMKPLRFSNDVTKVNAHKQGKYNQYSVTPRIFRQDGRCGVNGCEDREECLPQKRKQKSICIGLDLPCEWTKRCRSVDISAPESSQRLHFSMASNLPQIKLDNLDHLRKDLRNKHLRIRSIYKFLDGCGFFTFPLIVMNQLLVAKQYGLIGDKKPFVYMPENQHYHDCVKSKREYSNRFPDFWEKWFEPVSAIDWRNVDESDVWEFTQDSILSLHYHHQGIHAYPYAVDKSEENSSWITTMRSRAIPIVKEYIIPRREQLGAASKAFHHLFKSSDKVLAIHMRGTDKFVHPKVKNVIVCRSFLFSIDRALICGVVCGIAHRSTQSFMPLKSNVISINTKME